MRRTLLAFAPLLILAACSHGPAEDVVITTPGSKVAMAGWRRIATDSDRLRLRDWRTTFVDAIAGARAAGRGAAIDAEGPLLQPDSAIGGGLPNGAYACRVIKVGAKSAGSLDYIAYPGFRCRVQAERGLQGFAKMSGSQRPIGLIFPDSDSRSVFLGTLVLGDEPRAMQYGRDPDRDIAGWVERIGEGRWRLMVPEPRFESKMDIYELTPAGE